MKNGDGCRGRRSRPAAPTVPATIAAPVVRAIPVTPAAAERSSGSTTAITYDWRVGTSIWLRLKRSSSTPIASGRFGISGTRISSRFDGRWVKTIVLTRPIRAAIRAADRLRHGRQQVGPEEDPAEQRRLDAVAQVEPVGHQALGHEPAGERVDREQGGQAQRRCPCDRPRPRRRRIPSVWAARGGASIALPSPAKPRAMATPTSGVADDDRPVGVGRREAGGQEPLAEDAGTPAPRWRWPRSRRGCTRRTSPFDGDPRPPG